MKKSGNQMIPAIGGLIIEWSLYLFSIEGFDVGGMNTWLQSCRVDKYVEAPCVVHQVQVVRVPNPAVWTGQDEFKMEVDLQVGGHVLVVQEYRANLARQNKNQH